MSQDKLEQFTSDLQKKIAAVILQSPSSSDSQVAELVVKEDGSHPSKSYVSRVRNTLGITPTEAEAKEPEITVTKEAEVHEVTEQELGEGLPTEETREETIGLPPEAPVPTAEAPTSDDEILKPIFDRGFNRLLNDVLIKRLLSIQEKIANDEEITDIETLALIDLKRLTGKQLTGDNLLIGTNIVAVAPLVAKAVDAYRKRKEAEKPSLPPPPPPEPQKEEPKTEEPKKFDKNDPNNVPRFMRAGGMA